MSVRTSLLLAAIAFLVAACSGGTGSAGNGARSVAASGQTARPHKQKQTSVFTPLTSTIDRAKGVQTTVDEQAAKERKLIEQESR